MVGRGQPLIVAKNVNTNLIESIFLDIVLTMQNKGSATITTTATIDTITITVHFLVIAVAQLFHARITARKLHFKHNKNLI